MGSCNHIGWFYLSGRDNLYIHYGRRIACVIQEMTDPERQRPSMAFFLGRTSKDAALRQIFPNNNIRRERHDGIVNLRLDSSTISSELPLLFADADAQASVPQRLGAMTCHENTTVSLAWPSPHSKSALHMLYARLVALFSHVICIFADDFGGLDNVTKFLTEWIKAGNPSSLPISLRPRVIVVTGEEEAATHDVLAVEGLRQGLQNDHDARISAFSSISIMHLAGEHVSPLARHRRLKELILSEIELSRMERIQQRAHFTAIHFEAFFRQAIDHVASSVTEPFDFVQKTRMSNEIGEDYRSHLHAFLSLGKDYFLSYESLTSYLASTILMDAYPPRMHRFDPKLVFQSLYKEHCFSTFLNLFNSPMFAEDLCTRVQEHMDCLFPAIDLDFETSAQFHSNHLKSLTIHWNQLGSHHTCLFCLRRKPEHVLTCEHAVCDICVIRFGNPVMGKEAHFALSSCILCQTKGRLVAKLKPPTAGARILSVDGGGVRGVVPLEFLGLLQDLLDPGLPVQDLFELAFGTSSGGLIVLGLFVKHWDVERCTKIFNDLIRDFFGIHMTKGSGLLTRLRDLFRCWLTDGRYDVGKLESSLKDVFGIERRLFDVNRFGPSGQKVAVTATTLSDAFTYIFSNYNGRPRERNCGYKHVRPNEIENEPFVWEAGRVTSAAPGLFKPAFIASLGSFQDGGLRHNNPMDLALWECAKLWPSSTQPDVVLSLGTGTEDDLKSPKAPKFRHLLNDGFIPRLCRSFMSSLDGERTWRNIANRLDESTKADYFRLNVPWTGEEPRLDDVDCMDALRRLVQLQPQGSRDRTRIASALLVASFYFELDGIPTFQTGQYLCKGVIRCRNDFRAVSSSLLRIHNTQLELTTDTESLGLLTSDDICEECHVYCKSVQFHVRSLEDVATMFVKINGLERRKISGFPHSMSWFSRQQHLDAPFGRTDHDLERLTKCLACTSHQNHRIGRRTTRKRKRQRSEASRKRVKRG